MQRRSLDTISTVIVWAFSALTLAALASAIRPPQLPITPDDVVVSVAWWLAVAVAWWWTASVGYWWLAIRRADRSPVAGRWALPGTRAIAERFLAPTMLSIGLAASCANDAGAPRMTLLGDAAVGQIEPSTTEPAAAPSTAPPSTSFPSTSFPSTSFPSTTAPSTTAPSTTAPSTALPSTTLAPTPPPPTPPATTEPGRPASEVAPTPDPPGIGGDHRGERTVVVEPGDHLWGMARAALLAGRPVDAPPPTCAEIVAYWRRVLDRNEVRSGDPDLIVPGETIVLPAIETIDVGT